MNRSRVIFWVLMGFAAFYLLAEQRRHLAGLGRWLPVLILLACPLLHVFGHGRHGGHGGHAGHTTPAVPGAEHTDSRVSALGNEGSAPADDARPPRSHAHRGDLP